MEHTTLHLLYSRFWNKFLYDIGAVPVSEPYKRRVSHGMILATDGEKMSKSRGNVINPDDVVEEYGADVLRTYEMFIGPYDQSVSWDTNGIKGVKRFLDKVWALQEKYDESYTFNVDEQPGKARDKLLHQVIKEVTNDVESMKFNTAVSSIMILTNSLWSDEKISKFEIEVLLSLLNPFAPHLVSEITETLKLKIEKWPVFDPEKAIIVTKEIVVQVNGKNRDKIALTADEDKFDEDTIKELALKSENVKKYLAGKEPKRVIYIKDKLVNIVV